jgi:soluble lytic murein transglycosylase-like protein
MNVKHIFAVTVLGLSFSISSASASELGGNYAQILSSEKNRQAVASLGRQEAVVAGSALTGDTQAAEAPRNVRSSRRSARRAATAARAPSGPAELRQLVAKHAAANGVPPALAHAVVMVESRYNPRVSNGGAMGLMQIKPQTARGEGFSGPASALYDAETNVRYGMRYLGAAYRKAGGDVCGTVRYYQSGLYARGMSGANRAYCGKARGFMAQVAGRSLSDG